jgi:hypothetical protein
LIVPIRRRATRFRRTVVIVPVWRSEPVMETQTVNCPPNRGRPIGGVGAGGRLTESVVGVGGHDAVLVGLRRDTEVVGRVVG